MLLKEYIAQLARLAKENPEALEMQVIYSRDDEGNGFQPVHYHAGLGKFTDGGEFEKSETPNAVCLN